jgi:hypothetical protein
MLAPRTALSTSCGFCLPNVQDTIKILSQRMLNTGKFGNSLPSTLWCIDVVLSLTSSESSSILERTVCSCPLLNPDPNGIGESFTIVFKSIIEGSALVFDSRWVIAAWNIRCARQMTPKPTKNCRRESPRCRRFIRGGFESVIFADSNWVPKDSAVQYLFVTRILKKWNDIRREIEIVGRKLYVKAY